MNHDQNFKNLILDYPREALAFFAESEALDLPPDIRITPIRQEQLQERLGERFRELDTPLLVEAPSCTGRKTFVPGLQTPTRAAICCELGGMPYRRYRDSTNIVARLNLPNMRYEPEERVDVYAAAVRGLSTLEPDPERQLKYVDYIDIYGALDDNERQRYERVYPQETQVMTTYLQQVRQQSRQEGEQGGVRKGETLVLLRLLRLKFGEIPDATGRRIETADADTLLTWSERILTAECIDDIFP